MSSLGRKMGIAVAVAGVLLIGLYVALGGGRYTPLATQNPCEPRAWRDPSGAQGIVEQIALSSLDGAACELGVSREELALALADDGELASFGREHDVDQQRLETVMRSGLQRAVRDGQRAGALTPLTAVLASQGIDRIPLDRLIEAYRTGQLDFLGALLP